MTFTNFEFLETDIDKLIAHAVLGTRGLYNAFDVFFEFKEHKIYLKADWQS